MEGGSGSVTPGETSVHLDLCLHRLRNYPFPWPVLSYYVLDNRTGHLSPAAPKKEGSTPWDRLLQSWGIHLRTQLVGSEAPSVEKETFFRNCLKCVSVAAAVTGTWATQPLRGCFSPPINCGT